MIPQRGAANVSSTRQAQTKFLRFRSRSRLGTYRLFVRARSGRFFEPVPNAGFEQPGSGTAPDNWTFSADDPQMPMTSVYPATNPFAPENIVAGINVTASAPGYMGEWVQTVSGSFSAGSEYFSERLFPHSLGLSASRFRGAGGIGVESRVCHHLAARLVARLRMQHQRLLVPAFPQFHQCPCRNRLEIHLRATSLTPRSAGRSSLMMLP